MGQQANRCLQINQSQNTAIVSIPSKVAKLLLHITQTKIGKAEHTVEVCGLAPNDAVRSFTRSPSPVFDSRNHEKYRPR